MKYRGYTARIDFDASDNLFVGEIVGLSEQLTFHGAGVDELRADFEFAINHYLASCAAIGIAPEKPASGKLLIRIPPEIHAAATVAAAASAQSLNQWIVGVLQKAIPH